MRSDPCNGCGRLVDSNLRTNTSSDASTNRIRREILRSAKSATDFVKSSKNSPPRTSITTAIAVVVLAAISQRFAIIDGGKLSTTYQPRSSRACETVDLPAPLIPVITRTSLDPMA